MKTKVCSKCKEEKSAEGFYKYKRSKDGLSYHCKACDYLYSSWKKNHPDKVKESRRRWKKNNPGKVKEYTRKWKKNHPDKVKEAAQRCYKNNPDKPRERSRNWYKNNIDRAKEQRKKYFLKNSDKLVTLKFFKYKSNLSTKDIPIEVIELYKLNLKLKREVKNGTSKSI